MPRHFSHCASCAPRSLPPILALPSLPGIHLKFRPTPSTSTGFPQYKTGSARSHHAQPNLAGDRDCGADPRWLRRPAGYRDRRTEFRAFADPAGAKPTAAHGMAVSAFATGLSHPRSLYVLPNGDVLVAETDAPPKPDDTRGIKGWIAKMIMSRAGSGSSSANRITLLRDTDGDGVADTRSILLKGLNSPFGMALVGADLYVADTDAIMRFPYHDGDTKIDVPGVKLAELPAGTINHHWTKDLTASPDGSKLYATVGSNSNVGENGIAAETNRAAVLEVDRASGASRVFASGLRNPNGPSWQPQSGALWVTVNERDELGDDLVPDYMTSVKDGGFYGWPYSYYGQP